MRDAAEIARDLSSLGPLDETKVQRFDALLAEAVQSREQMLIPILLARLDDGSPFHDVVFGVVHAVESFPGEAYFHALASNLAQMQQRAPEWCELLHTRILNSPPHFEAFLTTFQSLDRAARDQEIEILSRISADPNFAARCRIGIERLQA